MQPDWVSPQLAFARAPDLAVMTHSNRAAVFHLSLLIAGRMFSKHLLCQRNKISTCLGMTPGLGPFRSRKEANQPTDWQKHANRVALKYSCCSALFLTLTFAAGTVFWIAAEFFTGVVWIIAYVLPDYDHWLNSNKGTKSRKAT
jgi:hypothetical protein